MNLPRSVIAIYIRPGGRAQAIYSDTMLPLPPGARVARAAHVEPNPGGGWDVTLSVGPQAGAGYARGVPCRATALLLEHEAIARLLEQGTLNAREENTHDLAH